MEIRSATSADQVTLVDLQRRASLAAYGHIFPPEQFPYPLAAKDDWWRALLVDESATVIVAEVDSHIAGVVVVTGHVIQTLYVAPERWRRGIGRALLDHACKQIADAGHTVAQLFVMEANLRARSLYESVGWSA